jgi:surface protein
MRINEDYLDIEDQSNIITDTDSDLSMDVRQNVQWLLDGLDTNIDFSLINEPIYKPKDGKELRTLIRKCVKKYGNECSLNWIDVSGRHNFSNMFYNSKFNGDISKWDVSEAIDMYQMFAESEFNGNLSSWDVSQVENMSYMFSGAKFNNDSLASWDVRNVKDMNAMFKFSDFNGDISEWWPRRVMIMNYMFY